MADSEVSSTPEGRILQRLQNAPSINPSNARLFTDWALEPGDIVTVQSDGEDYDVPLYSMSINWNGSTMVDVASSGNEVRDPLPALQRKQYAAGLALNQAVEDMEETVSQYQHFIEDTDAYRKEIYRVVGIVVDPDTGEIVYQTDPQTGAYITDAAGNKVPAFDPNSQYSIYKEVIDTAQRWSQQITSTAEGLQSQITQEAGRITQIVSAVGTNGQVTAASIVTAINSQDGVTQSVVTIQADKIELDGNAVIGAINGATTPEGETAVTIEADKIDLSGYVSADDIFVDGDATSHAVSCMSLDVGEDVNIDGDLTMSTTSAITTGTVEADSLTANETLYIGETDISDVVDAVTGFGEATYDGGQVIIPFYTLANPSGDADENNTINFNIADTAFYQSHVGVKEATLNQVSNDSEDYSDWDESADADFILSQSNTAYKYGLVRVEANDGIGNEHGTYTYYRINATPVYTAGQNSVNVTGPTWTNTSTPTESNTATYEPSAGTGNPVSTVLKLTEAGAWSSDDGTWQSNHTKLRYKQVHLRPGTTVQEATSANPVATVTVDATPVINQVSCIAEFGEPYPTEVPGASAPYDVEWYIGGTTTLRILDSYDEDTDTSEYTVLGTGTITPKEISPVYRAGYDAGSGAGTTSGYSSGQRSMVVRYVEDGSGNVTYSDVVFNSQTPISGPATLGAGGGTVTLNLSATCSSTDANNPYTQNPATAVKLPMYMRGEWVNDARMNNPSATLNDAARVYIKAGASSSATLVSAMYCAVGISMLHPDHLTGNDRDSYAVTYDQSTHKYTVWSTLRYQGTAYATARRVVDPQEAILFGENSVTLTDPAWSSISGSGLPAVRTVKVQTVGRTTPLQKEVLLYLVQPDEWTAHKKLITLKTDNASTGTGRMSIEVNATGEFEAGTQAVGVTDIDWGLDGVGTYGTTGRVGADDATKTIELALGENPTLQGTSLIFDIVQVTGPNTTVDTHSNAIATYSKTNVSLSYGDGFKNGKYTITGTGGKVSFGNKDITTNPNSNFVIPLVRKWYFGAHGAASPAATATSKAYVSVEESGTTEILWSEITGILGTPTFEWNETNRKYTVSGVTGTVVDQGNITVLSMSKNDVPDLVPTDAINAGKGDGFSACYNSIKLVADKQSPAAGETVTVKAQAFATTDASTETDVSNSNTTSWTYTIPNSPTPTTPKVHKGTWSSGSISFTATNAADDPTQAGVSLSINATAPSVTASAIVGVKDGNGNTGLSKTFYLKVADDYAYITNKDATPSTGENNTEANVVARVTNTAYVHGQNSVKPKSATIVTNSTVADASTNKARCSLTVKYGIDNDDSLTEVLNDVDVSTVYQAGKKEGTSEIPANLSYTVPFRVVMGDGASYSKPYVLDALVDLKEVYNKGVRDYVPDLSYHYIGIIRYASNVDNTLWSSTESNARSLGKVSQYQYVHCIREPYKSNWSSGRVPVEAKIGKNLTEGYVDARAIAFTPAWFTSWGGDRNELGTFTFSHPYRIDVITHGSAGSSTVRIRQTKSISSGTGWAKPGGRNGDILFDHNFYSEDKYADKNGAAFDTYGYVGSKHGQGEWLPVMYTFSDSTFASGESVTYLGYVQAKFVVNTYDNNGTEEAPLYPDYPHTGTIDSQSGGPVYMRESADYYSSRVTTIPNGAAVYCASNPNGFTGLWMPVAYTDGEDEWFGYVQAVEIKGTKAYNDAHGVSPQKVFDHYEPVSVCHNQDYYSGTINVNVTMRDASTWTRIGSAATRESTFLQRWNNAENNTTAKKVTDVWHDSRTCSTDIPVVITYHTVYTDNSYDVGTVACTSEAF